VALARRATEGGSWLVRTSLAQVGRWIVAQGLLPAASLEGMPAELDPAELDPWMTESDTPAGRLRHMAPALEMSATPPHWELPAVPLGTHPPEWW
jgi:hypothetical protein